MLAVVKRIERIRLYPTTSQAAALAAMLDVTRDLYNALLQQRRDAYRLRKITVTAKMQYAEITALRAEDGRPLQELAPLAAAGVPAWRSRLTLRPGAAAGERPRRGCRQAAQRATGSGDLRPRLGSAQEQPLVCVF